MTEDYKVILPKLGESIVNATVVQWFKKEGDTVSLDEPLLEVSTDKINSEIPAPTSGILLQILAQPDQEIQVGDPLAVIRLHQSPQAEKGAEPKVEMRRETSNSVEMKDFFSPALLRVARENGITLDELENIPSTGLGGRLTKRDLELYLESKKNSAQRCPAMTQSISSEIERVKMSGIRKVIADNMVRSFYEAPHATLITEVDVTAVAKFIQKEKEAFLTKQGAKLTITSFIARAMSRALREYPFLNSSLEDDTIVIKRFVNLGIAVSVDQGIVVPVIKGAQAMSITDLAKTISDLSSRARLSKLHPTEVQEGTITLTNFGISGVMIGIPIIRHPEVAIVGVGAVQKKVVVLDDNLFGARSMLHVSLTFDHRVLDGMYGCGFLHALKEHLESDDLISLT